MNEMNYRPNKELTLSGLIRQQAETEADFTYSIRGNVISIVDLDQGNRSVTNDVESVLRKIEHYHQGSIAAFTSCIAILRELGMGNMHHFLRCAKRKRDEFGINSYNAANENALELRRLPPHLAFSGKAR